LHVNLIWKGDLKILPLADGRTSFEKQTERRLVCVLQACPAGNPNSKVGHESHDPSFHLFLMDAGVMTFVARCTHETKSIAKVFGWCEDFLLFILMISILPKNRVLCKGLSIYPTVHLKYIQAFLRALKSPSYKCVLIIGRALKSPNVNACRVSSNTFFPIANHVELYLTNGKKTLLTWETNGQKMGTSSPAENQMSSVSPRVFAN